MGKLASVLLAIIGLTACATPPLPEDHYYRLETVASSTPQIRNGADATVTVLRLNMTGVYNERPLLYSTAAAPTELRQYHYHYWADNPEHLIQEQLADFLRAELIFRRVNLPNNSSAVTDDYQISGSVRRFEQRLDGSGAHALVEIELTLARKTNSSTLLSKIYRADIATRDNTALASAQGLSQALTQCFAQFAADLRTINPPLAHHD